MSYSHGGLRDLLRFLNGCRHTSPGFITVSPTTPQAHLFARTCSCFSGCAIEDRTTTLRFNRLWPGWAPAVSRSPPPLPPPHQSLILSTLPPNFLPIWSVQSKILFWFDFPFP